MAAAEQLRILEEHQIDYLHFDVIDGWFAPEFGLSTKIINQVRQKCCIRSDYHLMLEEPSRTINAFQFGAGDIVTIHQEACRNLHRELLAVRETGARSGIALCPETPLDTLDYVIEDADVILLMAVNPGYNHQVMFRDTIEKLKCLRTMVDQRKLETKLAVEGNIHAHCVPELVASGADILVGGSQGLFREDIALSDGIRELKESIEIGLQSRN